MDILQVSPRYPPQSGGVETHVTEISERLVELGHTVTVVTADAGKEGSHHQRRNGVQIRRHHSIAPNETVHFCPQIGPAVHRSEADVVHAHNYHSFPVFFAALGITDQRFVVTTHYHGASASPLRDRLLSLYRPFGQWAIQRADELIAVSEWEREQLAAEFGLKATVIPNGINVDIFAEADPTDREQPYLLTVGRLEKYKGVQHVIRAMPMLPEYELLVAGSGRYREELERVADETGVADRVLFLGYVDDEQLPQLYAGADVYVTMSEFEAYGMTVAEALAAGTPCVVRQDNALNDWTTIDSCFGLSNPTSRELADAIIEACALNPAPASLPQWDDVVKQLLERYQR